MCSSDLAVRQYLDAAADERNRRPAEETHVIDASIQEFLQLGIERQYPGKWKAHEFGGATTIESWPLFVFWIVAVSVIFGLAGILIGLWSKSFEQLNMPVVFFLTPLSMLGGSFFTMKMLPGWLHWLLWANPFFYFINGIRGAMIGIDEAPQGLSIGLTLLMIAALGGLVWRLFSRGYGLRE